MGRVEPLPAVSGNIMLTELDEECGATPELLAKIIPFGEVKVGLELSDNRQSKLRQVLARHRECFTSGGRDYPCRRPLPCNN